MSANKMEMNVRKSFTPNPVFIDAPSRSGKGAVGFALASLARTEHLLTRNIIDRLWTLYSVGLLEKNAAIDSIITERDFKLWFNYLGRNLNTNVHDITSVLNSRDPEMYKKRMEGQDTEEAFNLFLETIKREQPITLDITDEMLYESELLYEAFPNLKIVVVMRHPIDLAFSWHRSGRGWRYGKDPRMIHPTFNFGNIKNIPTLAIDWPDEYNKLNPVEKASKSISMIMAEYINYLEEIPPNRKESIIVVPFEEFITNTHLWLNKLCDFLGTETTDATPRMLKQARVPRVINVKDFEKKYYGLKYNVSDEIFTELMICSERFEKLINPVFSINEVSKEDPSFSYSTNFNDYFPRPAYIKGERKN